MKHVLASVTVVAALAVSPALAQTLGDSLKAAATQAATQAATDQVNKAAGAGTTTRDADDRKVRKDKTDHEPNHGKSEDHRQDEEHGHKGKGKGHNKD